MTYVYEINGVRKEFIYNLHYIVFTVDNVPANNEGAMVEIDKNEKAYLCYRNEQGYLYFEYQDHTVFCKNAINVLTPEEFIRFAYGDDADFAYKCNNGKPLHVIASEELCKTLQKYGLESIYVRINESPLRYEGWKENKKIFSSERFSSRISSTKETYNWRFYHFVPVFNRMPIDNYKLLLEDRYHSSGYSHDFYVSDFNNMWMVRPDYMQLELGKRSEPNGLFGRRKDSKIRKNR